MYHRMYGVNFGYWLQYHIGTYVRTYSGTSLLRSLWDLDVSPYYRGVLTLDSFNTLQYYTGTQNGVLIIVVAAIQRFVIERFHCICVCTLYVHTHV